MNYIDKQYGFVGNTYELWLLLLYRWKTRFVDHLKMSINLLKSGKNIQGHISREQLTSAEKMRQVRDASKFAHENTEVKTFKTVVIEA